MASGEWRVISDEQKAAHAACALGRAAQIVAPHIIANQRICRGGFGQQIPAIIQEIDAGDRHPVGHVLLNPTALRIIHKAQLIMRPHVGVNGHPDQPVLGIPRIAPAAVIGQVAIQIVLKLFRRLCHVQVTRHVVPRSHHHCAEPGRLAGIVRPRRAVEIFQFAVRRHAIDRHIRPLEGRPHNIVGPRHPALRVLVQVVHRVVRHPQVCAVGVAPAARLGTVPNRVEGILILLPGNRGAVIPEPRPVGHLPQPVVLINPVRPVPERVPSPLVGGIVGVGIGDGQKARTTGRGRNLRQPVQIIVLFGRRHARRAARAEGNLAHQRRIGKIAVGGHMTVPVVDRQQPRGIVMIGV